MNETVNIANPKIANGGRRLRPAVDELEGSLIRQVAETNIGRDDVIALWSVSYTHLTLPTIYSV